MGEKHLWDFGSLKNHNKFKLSGFEEDSSNSHSVAYIDSDTFLNDSVIGNVVELSCFKSKKPTDKKDVFYYNTDSQWLKELQYIDSDGDGHTYYMRKDFGIYTYKGIPFKFDGEGLVLAPSGNGMSMGRIPNTTGQLFKVGSSAIVGDVLDFDSILEYDETWRGFILSVKKGDRFAIKFNAFQHSANYQFLTFTDTDKKIVSINDYEYEQITDSYLISATEQLGSAKYLFSFVAPSDGYMILNIDTKMITSEYNNNGVWYSSRQNEELAVRNRDNGAYFGMVPGDDYEGYLSDYSSGGASTSYASIIALYDTLADDKNADYVTKTSIGTASDGQTLYAYTFIPKFIQTNYDDEKQTNRYTKNYPTIFIVSGQHGYEKGSVFGLYHFLKDVVTNYENNPFLAYIHSHCRLIVVPAANPYGLDNSVYVNANSVNLNRNWNVPYWDGSGTGTEAAGTEPFDQPETKAISDYFNTCNAEQAVDLFIDFHTNSEKRIDKTTKPHYGIQDLNWIDLTLLNAAKDVEGQTRYDRMMSVCNEQAIYITRIFNKLFYSLLDITGASGEERRCSHVNYVRSFPTKGYADAWALIHSNAFAITLECFCGFPLGDLYCDEVKRGCSIILGNFIMNFLVEFSKD